MTITKPTHNELTQTGTGSSTGITTADLEGALVVTAVVGTVTDYNIETRPTAGTFISARGSTPRGGTETLDALAVGALFALLPTGTDDLLQDEIRITIVAGTGSVTAVVIEGHELKDWFPQTSESAARR